MYSNTWHHQPSFIYYGSQPPSYSYYGQAPPAPTNTPLMGAAPPVPMTAPAPLPGPAQHHQMHSTEFTYSYALQHYHTSPPTNQPPQVEKSWRKYKVEKRFANIMTSSLNSGGRVYRDTGLNPAPRILVDNVNRNNSVSFQFRVANSLKNHLESIQHFISPSFTSEPQHSGLTDLMNQHSCSRSQGLDSKVDKINVSTST